MSRRNVTAALAEHRPAKPAESITLDEQAWDEISGRNDPAQRFRLVRLCLCEQCGGTGKDKEWIPAVRNPRCDACRGEGRTLQLVATAATPEALGTALVTLAREGEFSECPIGLLQLDAEPGKRWLVKPWMPSPRNISDAGRTLNAAKRR